MNDTSLDPGDEARSELGAVMRFLWAVGGGIALAFSAAFIVRAPGPGIADVIYWTAVVGMTLARVIDVIYLKGETADGRPATVADLRRYLVLMPLITTLLWLAASAVGRNGWLN